MRRKDEGKAKAPKNASRLVRTIRSLITIVSIGVILAIYNAVSLRRDIAVAIGPEGDSQREFFKGASERPDITTFFKNLGPERRLKMAQNIGHYDDAPLAALCGKLLDSFDPVARKALTDSLSRVALVHPDAVAAQFNLPGSFQQLAIATALRKAGTRAIPLVDKQLSVNDARPNAIAYLVSSGTDAIAPTLPYLDQKDKDTRLAAVDALGKLRAVQAVPKLLTLYHGSKEEERLSYFTALATIGEPSTEPLMSDVLRNVSLPTPLRAQAALGLGRIGTESAEVLDWQYTQNADQTIRESAISALQLAGDPALRLGLKAMSGLGPESDQGDNLEATDQSRRHTMLVVAGGIRTQYADSIIESGLSDPSTTIQAARSCTGRPELVSQLIGTVKLKNADDQGDVIDAILKSLTTTSKGRTALERLSADSSAGALGALASRRLKLGAG
ncbi:MAG: hypothetical protein P4L46_04220 [Fimbriimonas sp.]|nr:hypothetical protein [Fimbriimonas sp.]